MIWKLSDHIKEAVAADLRRDWWYKPGEATFNPSLPHMREPRAIEDYILAGWLPTEPFIGPKDRVTFIGCCFGSSLLNYMKTMQFEEPGEIDTTFIPISETLSSSFAMRQMFEWEFEGIKPDPEALKGNRAMEINFTDALWKDTLKRLSITDVYILQISTAEVWYDEPTGAVVWRETPGANPERQKFRTSTVQENRANIRTIYDIIRKHRPNAKLILMLSPIPMIATYRTQSCISANTVSKAVLRAAMDEVWREAEQEGYLFYCPFYEVIQEGFGATPYGGHYNGDRRHINDAALDYLLVLFEKYYCKVRALNRPVMQAYVTAKVSAGELPRELPEAIERGDRRALQKMIDHYESVDDEPAADLVAAYAAEMLPPIVEDHTEEEGWQISDQVWHTHADPTFGGVAPQTLSLPPVAWAYGAYCGPFRADQERDLVVRVRLEVLTGMVGILLARPDGSSLSGNDKVVTTEDGPTSVDLQLYHDDGPAQIILRNYDSEGVAVSVRVEEVAVKPRPTTAPARNVAA